MKCVVCVVVVVSCSSCIVVLCSKKMSMLLSELSLIIENLCSGVVKDICSRNGLSYDIEWCHIERLLKGGDVDVSVSKSVSESVGESVVKSVSKSVAESVVKSVSCDSRIALPFSGDLVLSQSRLGSKVCLRPLAQRP